METPVLIPEQDHILKQAKFKFAKENLKDYIKIMKLSF